MSYDELDDMFFVEEQLARDILWEAGLPHKDDDLTKPIAIYTDGSFELVEEYFEETENAYCSDIPFGIGRTVYGGNSIENYACILLLHLKLFRKSYKSGNIYSAACDAKRIGSLATRIELTALLDKHAAQSLNVLGAAKKGHKITHGSYDEKIQRWQGMVEHFNFEVSMGTKRMAAYQIVGERFGVSYKTVQRAVERLQEEPPE